MVSVACVMMQKDETGLLQAWLAYHGYLFGFENLYVFDNGSSDQHVRATLQRYNGIGVNVEWSASTPEDYLKKHLYIGRLISDLQHSRRYDIIIPLDCDEFVVKKTVSGVTCSKSAIVDYLGELAGETKVLRVPYQLANHPLVPDFYSYFGFHKIFFSAARYQETDHGFHHIRAREGVQYLDTRIIHLHFHNKPFPELLRVSARKLAGRVDLSDIGALRSYNGPSGHLVKYFLSSEAEYYKSFDDAVHWYIPGLRRTLAGLGASIDLHPGRRTNLEDELARLETAWGADPDEGNDTRTRGFIPAIFNEDEYRKANTDIADRDLNPFVHFCKYGYKESRRLSRP